MACPESSSARPGRDAINPAHATLLGARVSPARRDDGYSWATRTRSSRSFAGRTTTTTVVQSQRPVFLNRTYFRPKRYASQLKGRAVPHRAICSARAGVAVWLHAPLRVDSQSVILPDGDSATPLRSSEVRHEPTGQGVVNGVITAPSTPTRSLFGALTPSLRDHPRVVWARRLRDGPASRPAQAYRRQIIEARGRTARTWAMFRAFSSPAPHLPMAVVTVWLTINVINLFDVIYVLTGVARNLERMIAPPQMSPSVPEREGAKIPTPMSC